MKRRRRTHDLGNQRFHLEKDVALSLARWKRRAAWSSVVFVLNVLAVIPFLYGFRLRAYWDLVGKKVLLAAMISLLVWVHCAAMAYVFWSYLRRVANKSTDTQLGD